MRIKIQAAKESTKPALSRLDWRKYGVKKMSLVQNLQALTATVIVSLTASWDTASADALDIYFIDVEGGQSTLVVTPAGETLLIDAGYAGQGKSNPVPGDAKNSRDAQRVAAAARDAGISHIDNLLVTHFHQDHFGGVKELSQLISIGTIIDHDTPAPEALVQPGRKELFDSYVEVREKGNHIVPAVGDRIPMEGIEVTVVSTAGSTLQSSLVDAGAVNTACDRTVPGGGDRYENPRSTGILLQYGEFRFLDLGDLNDQPLSNLVCPIDRIGSVDVYLVSHHGGADVADPATFEAFRPRVAILNNGANKGGAAEIFDVLRDAEGLDDVWQVHRSEAKGAENFSDERIANLDEQTAHWIKISASSDGSFRIFNGRTGDWKDY